MTLPVPYFVYGNVTDSNNSNIESATVYASGNSSATSGATTTNADGNYQINLQDCSSDGDTIKVIATSGAYSKSDTFTLTLGNPPEQIDLQLPTPAGGNLFINHVPDKYVKINFVQGNPIYIK